MADVTIPDLPQNVSPASTAKLAIDSAGTSEHADISDLLKNHASQLVIDRHRGTHDSLTDLINAFPSPTDGSFAVVTQGDGTDAVIAVWDSDESTPAWKIAAPAPPTHATSHESGGADPIQLDDLATPDSGTDLDATTSTHGLMSHADKVAHNKVVRAVEQGAQVFAFSTSTSDADPTNGILRFDNGTPASVENMYISDTAASGLDITSILADIVVDNKIVFAQQDNLALRMVFEVDGAVTDNGDYFTVPLSSLGSPSALFGNGKDLLVEIRGGRVTDAEKILIATNQTNIAAQGPTFKTLTDADPIVWAAGSKVETAIVTLSVITGTRELGLITGIAPGNTYTLIVKQDGGGGELLTYNSAYEFPDETAPVLSTGGTDVDILSMVVETTGLIYLTKTPNFGN